MTLDLTPTETRALPVWVLWSAHMETPSSAPLLRLGASISSSCQTSSWTQMGRGR